MSLTASMRLGPYEVLPAIGAGGTAEVHTANDTPTWTGRVGVFVEERASVEHRALRVCTRFGLRNYIGLGP
jgi:hypothetical protein